MLCLRDSGMCVLLDNKLSWKPHVQRVKTQLSRACGILSKLKHYTTLPVLKVVCNSLIHPYLNYSILIWGRASNAIVQPLIKLQIKNNKSNQHGISRRTFLALERLMPFQTLCFVSRQIHALLLPQTASKSYWWIFYSNQLNSLLLH